MVKGTIKRNILIEKIDFIPRGGKSYPFTLRTYNPPYV